MSTVAVHVNWTEPHHEVYRRDIGEKYCFVCRKRRDFAHIVMAPTGMSWYGPHDRIECTTCKTVDGDCFPGTYREWVD